jgi:HEAT repeat protein
VFFEIEELKEKLQSEDPNERQEACYHLGKLEIREAFRILEQAVSDPDPMVQMIAGKSLQRLAMLGLGTLPAAPAAPEPPPAKPSGPGAFTLSLVPPVLKTAEPVEARIPPGPKPPSPKISLPPQSATDQTPLPPRVPPTAAAASTARSASPEAPENRVPAAPVQPTPPSPPSAPAQSEFALPSVEILPTEPPAKIPSASPPKLPSRPVAPTARATAPAKPTAAKSPEAGAEPASTDLSGDLDRWQEVIQERDDAFAVWFSKMARQEKIDLLANMETHPANIIWSKKVQSLLFAETDPFVLSKLLKVFGHLHGPRILKYVEPFLEHSDTRVVSNTLEALSLAGDKEDLERITQFLDHQDARIKSTAAQALWKSNPQRAMEVVKRLAASSRVWERDAAKFALASCPLTDRQNLMESLAKPKAKTPAPSIGAGPDIPGWAASLGAFGRFLVFPVHLGLGEPIPLYIILIAALSTLLFYFLILNPFFDWLFPVA